MKNSKVVVIFVVVLVAILFIFAAVVPAVAPSQPTAVAQSPATETVPAADASANDTSTESAPAQSDSETTESEPSAENTGSRKDVIRRLEEAFNQDDSSVIAELFSPDFVGHLPENPRFGTSIDIGIMTELVSLLYSALPNLHIESDMIIEEGDFVAQRALISGDFEGEFYDYPPTGDPISFAANVFYRFDDSGKIVEQWIEFDTVSVLQQFGVGGIGDAGPP